jgi:hypothetical protein
MVDTMAPLPSFIRCALMNRRSARPADRPETGDEAVLDAPDDRLSPALVAAGRGEYAAAAALLTATRAAAAWENHDRYVRHLAAFARSRPEWFDAWLTAVPQDRAELLREVSPLITAAARADDRDPVPWRIALDHARGSGAGHRYVEELWEAAVRRAPHHHGCHVAALRYLGTSWHGAHRECLDFADRAAQDAPADSLVQALPARAALGYLSDGCGPEVPRARLDAAADRALALSERLPAADPWPAGIRNELLYVLLRLERWEDARAQLALVGPYATSFPWDRFSDDPLGHFLRLREHLLTPGPRPLPAGPAPWSPVPLGGHGGHVHAGDH